MTIPFGYSYLLDMYGCKDGICEDLSAIYRFLESLVESLGMTPIAPPVVFLAPRKNGVELFPDKVGVSGWAPLIESGIQIHCVEPAHFISLDVFSCRAFNQQVVYEPALLRFGFTNCEEQFFHRGTSFPRERIQP